MDARYYVTLEKYLRPKDKAVVYAHGGKFVAVIEFTDGFFLSKENIGWTKNKNDFLFPYRIKFKIVAEAKRPPSINYSTTQSGDEAVWSRPGFIDDVVFIADKGRTWNQYLQVSIIKITEEDFNTISGAIIRS